MAQNIAVIQTLLCSIHDKQLHDKKPQREQLEYFFEFEGDLGKFPLSLYFTSRGSNDTCFLSVEMHSLQTTTQQTRWKYILKYALELHEGVLQVDLPNK